jgi:glutathione synthase/RimK-type ligase-like ATP-grasp enzyme
LNSHPLNSHARFAALAAKAMGWRFALLDSPDGYVFEAAEGARRAVIACGSASPYALNSAAAMSLARDKGFAALALARAGVPHIPGALFFTSDRHAAFRAPGREPQDARATAKRFDYPVFCKPASGSRGDFAEIIGNEAAFGDYLARVSPRHEAILVQPLISGVEHRVIVLQGRALCSYEKTPLQVTGDGAQTLAQLVTAARANAKPTTASLAPPETVQGLSETGDSINPSSIPAAGQRVTVLGPQNRSAGGDAKAVLSPAPQALATVALNAARALGLRFAGVDLFDTPTGIVVIESNASPALLTLEAHGRMDLIEAVWRANWEAALQ